MFSFKTVLAGAVIAGLVAVGAVAAANASEGHRAGGFSYIVQNAGTEYLTKAGLTATFPGRLETGDQIFSRDILLRGSTRIGYDNMTCTVTFDSNDLCRTISVFSGQGDVEATWLWVGRNNSLYGPSHFAGIIDGGTGSFERATGHFDATALPNGRLRISARVG